MFGCVVAGRLIQTNLQQIDETHAIFELPDASTINHICVFLLGTVPFPDGYGATVHFHWPGRGFQLLGALSNDKPSAIFRLRGTFSSTSSLTHSAFQDPYNPSNPSNPSNPNLSTDATAILGISVEPFPTIQAELSSLPPATSPRSGSSLMSDSTILAERIVKHLFNFLSSFAVNMPVSGGGSGVFGGGIGMGGGVLGGGGGMTPETYVQMGAITKWYESFMSKIRVGGVGFLEREE